MGHASSEKDTAFGLVAEFGTDDELLEAAHAARKAGYSDMDGFSPLPIHGLSDALGQRQTRLPWLVFAMGLTGASFGFGLQTWVNLFAYPLNIGGRPLFSWPAFIPITFECTILFAGISTVIGLILSMRMPRHHHPIFNTPNFERVTVDRFFLWISAKDPKYDEATTRTFLEGLSPAAVSHVEDDDD